MIDFTNVTCYVYSQDTSYKGEDASELEETVSGWFEQGDIITYDKHSVGLQIVGRGTLFLWDDITVSGKKIVIGGETYLVASWARFTDPIDESFHHIEVTLK
jgi:hypothetical protein